MTVCYNFLRFSTLISVMASIIFVVATGQGYTYILQRWWERGIKGDVIVNTKAGEH